MDQDVFASRLLIATDVTVTFTRSIVTDILPDEVRFLIFPNQSYDGNPLVGDQEVFPADSLPAGATPSPVASDEVVRTLWRRGKVPQWIDLQVQSADARYTYMAVICCGRFTAVEGLLYYQTGDSRPLA
jgi:hypothetical protein